MYWSYHDEEWCFGIVSSSSIDLLQYQVQIMMFCQYAQLGRGLESATQRPKGVQSDVMMNNVINIITTAVIVININTVRPRYARTNHHRTIPLTPSPSAHSPSFLFLLFDGGGGGGVALSCNLGFASANHHRRCLYSYYYHPLTSLRSARYDGGGGTIIINNNK